ncbi:HORMA domain-containing protein 1 [Takifugu flavidus]|uniref:HORMA domain-containing protein 1 n=1 Tax=Takifugu flavidus TaxID=433684 RepID=A0A5C6PLI0_9TELE|nr:HORMA domain-containing protein 1 [Takifugu flavidus]
MACVQKMRTTQESQLLPNQVLSEQQSSLVIRKLLAIAVSGITYLRGVFPEKAYGTKYVEDQKVMILREEGSCPGATQIVQWLQGCFEAIQLKYLRTVILSLFTDPALPQHPPFFQNVTEFYQFNIHYTPEGIHMDFERVNLRYKELTHIFFVASDKVSMSCSNTKKASILLVRKLYTLMQNLGPLPDSVSLNMKLAYYEEVTPQDYQPPGFKEAEGDTLVFEKEPVKLTMGEVVTPYHTLKLGMATERHRLEQVEENVCVTEKWVLRMTAETQSHVVEDEERSEMEKADTFNPDIQMICHEKIDSCEESTQVDPGPLETSSAEVGQKRTRSGRIISSTTEKDVTVSMPAATGAKSVRTFLAVFVGCVRSSWENFISLGLSVPNARQPGNAVHTCDPEKTQIQRAQRTVLTPRPHAGVTAPLRFSFVRCAEGRGEDGPPGAPALTGAMSCDVERLHLGSWSLWLNHETVHHRSGRSGGELP